MLRDLRVVSPNEIFFSKRVSFILCLSGIKCRYKHKGSPGIFSAVLLRLDSDPLINPVYAGLQPSELLCYFNKPGIKKEARLPINDFRRPHVKKIASKFSGVHLISSRKVLLKIAALW